MKVPINQIHTNINNPRIIKDDKFRKLVQSIKEFPEMLDLRPIVVDEDMVILGGNMRHKACIEAGVKEVPIKIAKGLTEDQKLEFIIKDNASFGEWEWDMLANEWDSIQLAEWGLDVWENEDDKEPEAGLIEDDEIPEVKESKVKRGDIWQLGEHKIMCGDSTSADDVSKLMNGKKADLIHADPPYGMGKEKDGVLNDNLYCEKLDEFQMKWWNVFRKHTINKGSAYIWGNAPDLWRLWYNGGLEQSEHLEIRNEIVWDKKTIPGMKSPLMHQYPEASERCLYFQFGKQFIGNINTADFPEEFRPLLTIQQKELEKAGIDKKEVQRITGVQMYSHWFTESQFQIIGEKHYNKLQKETVAFKMSWKDLKKQWDEIKGVKTGIINEKLKGMRSYFDNAHDIMHDVWEFSRVHGEERYGHATPKPVEMMERCIKSSCPISGITVEPFLGSGATLIACEKTHRKCYGMELDENYCDVIIERWEQFTGLKAEKIN
tara:strand:- start:345 stop:1814 length:1470 start_codon:yes stop_codon:yes gene_type:complete